jgi:hypothetical protein
MSMTTAATTSKPPAPPRQVLSTREKALKINLEPAPYGTIAEIGAGQEVASWFFKVGAASGTIAKTISAYDMTMSDAIYGQTRQYVCRDRLHHMLDHEYQLLIDRLNEKWGEKSAFFAYANTVRAKAYGDTKQECHGWMGMRFQTTPGSAPHTIILHVRLFDDQLTNQQEAIGILGVNLIYATLYHPHDLKAFTETLLDGLNPWRIEIDLLKFDGPDFTSLDNRLCALQLVESGLTPSAYFTAEGEILQASEAFYKKPLLLLRGRFEPPLRVHLDMLETAAEAMQAYIPEGSAAPIEIMEFTTHNLLQGDERLGHTSFLLRATMLQRLGKNVLVSRFPEFHRLGAYLSRATREPIGIVLSTALLEELFQEKWYDNLDGGLLESFGRLFKHSLRLYVYPEIDKITGLPRPADKANIDERYRKLFEHLLENELIIPVEGKAFPGREFSAPEIRSMIEKNEKRWQDFVPPTIIDEVALAYGK